MLRKYGMMITFVLINMLNLSLENHGIADGNTIKINVGIQKELRIPLPSTPKTIEVENPDTVLVERVGLTNTIKIKTLSEGKSSILIKFKNGTQVDYLVTSGKGVQKELSEPSNSYHYRTSSTLRNIPGINTFLEDHKTIVFGEIKKLEHFKKLMKFAIKNPEKIESHFSISADIEDSAISAAQSFFKNSNEPQIKIKAANHIFYMTGVFQSNRQKKWLTALCEALFPGIIDATDSATGQGTMLLISLKFIEVSKDSGMQIGFQPPSSFASTMSSAATSLPFQVAPTFQLAPIHMIFKSLQNKNYTRELANPSMLIRSGEQGKLLVGGEVPIVYLSEKEKRVDFKPVGVMVEARPTIRSDENIWIDIKTELSSVNEAMKSNDTPSFQTRKIETQLTLKSGYSAIITGLTKSSDAKSIDKIPLIGSIPLIGELFKSRRFSENETELWLLVSAENADQSLQDSIDLERVSNLESTSKEIVRGSIND